MDESVEQQLLNEWKQSMENFVVNDIRGSLNRDVLEVGLIILTMVGIDCLSGYFTGKPADKTTFKQFVTSKYFPAAYHSLADDLFQLRNGLVHDYTSKNNKFVFFRKEGDGLPHLERFHNAEGESISLNREVLAKDFLTAWERYSSDVFRDRTLSEKALRRIFEAGRGFLVVKNITPLLIEEARDPNRAQYSGGTISWSERQETD